MYDCSHRTREDGVCAVPPPVDRRELRAQVAPSSEDRLPDREPVCGVGLDGYRPVAGVCDQPAEESGLEFEQLVTPVGRLSEPDRADVLGDEPVDPDGRGAVVHAARSETDHMKHRHVLKRSA